MRRICTYLVMIFSVLDLGGQAISFLPLDENTTHAPSRTGVAPDGFMSVNAEQGIGFRNASFSLRRWNGQFWVNYPGFNASRFPVGDNNLLSVCYHNGRIYAGGSFNSEDTSKVGIVSWNGSKWEKAAGGISSNYLIHQDISIFDMISYQGRLFVCGRFNLAGGNPVHNFVNLFNQQWLLLQTASGKVNDLEIVNDTLYAAGKFSQVEGVLSQNIAAYANGTWSTLAFPSGSEIIGLGKFGSSLMAFTKNTAYIRTGNLWSQALQKWDFNIKRYCNSAEYEGRFYMAGTFVDAQGNTSHLLRWDGQAWEVLVRQKDVSPSNRLNYFIDHSGSQLLFSGYITGFFGQNVKHVIQLFPGKTIVKGRLFVDENQNCIYDGGDKPLANALVSVNEGAYYTSCDAEGVYSTALEKNTKSYIRVFPTSELEAICQGEMIEITTGTKDSSLIRDFALQKKPLPPAGHDIGIHSSRGFKARHGYACDYSLSYKSDNGQFPVTLVLKHDKRLQFESADLEPLALAEGEIRWTLYSDKEIHLVYKLPLNIHAGETLLFRASATGNDASTAKPVSTELRQEVVSAYDPNEKQCNADKIDKTSRNLDYHIQFQNLGNDSAVNVYVVDTISNSLPMQFIRMVDHSHKDKYNISFKVRDHAIIWGFKDILLPPKSTAGDLGSSGFISFKAGLDNSLKTGDSISNRAHIYFDYQDPVNTNKVITRVVEGQPSNPGTGQAEVLMYPNPYAGELTIDMNGYLMKHISIYDANGRIVYQHSLSPYTGLVSIHPEFLSSGVYVVRIEHTFGVVSRKLVVTN